MSRGEANVPCIPETKNRDRRAADVGDVLSRVVCFNEKKIVSLRRRVASPGTLAAEAAAHKALAHAGRLAVARLLALEECCVCDVAHVLRLPISTASQHLRTLKDAGLVRSRQEGKLVFHSLTRPLPRQARNGRSHAR